MDQENLYLSKIFYIKNSKNLISHLIKNNYHDDDIIYRTLFNKYDIIIMDQFEESLDNDKFISALKN